jgi:hypothetical protein
VQVVNNDIGQGKLLSLPPFLKAPLHHTAPVLMRADLYAVHHACVENELRETLIVLASLAVWLLRVLGGLEYAKESLDYMVTVGALNLRLKEQGLTKLSSLI